MSENCCGMHGNLCAIADGPVDLCCNECPLLAGHIEVVGYTRTSAEQAEAEALPDDVYDAGVRALLQCPDVPEHAHVTMESLHRMAAEVAPWIAIRAAFTVAYQAGVAHGLDIAEDLDNDTIEERAGQQMDALLDRVFGADDSRRVLGDLLDAHPQLDGLLSSIPYVRRTELEALIEVFGELLGADNAS